MRNKIIIIDFGSQTTQLIARRVRELSVYCEIHPYNKIPKYDDSVKGIIISGGPFSIAESDAPELQLDEFYGNTPILGIGFGAQILIANSGGSVVKQDDKDISKLKFSKLNTNSPLFKNIGESTDIRVLYNEKINSLPNNFATIASYEDDVLAFSEDEKNIYGVLFHPETSNSFDGRKVLENFVINICESNQDWSSSSFVANSVADLKAQLGSDKVVLGLSGGVDSSVAAILLHKAIGQNLTCIFVNNGLLRKNEFSSVLESYKTLGLNVIGVDAKDRFLSELAGVTDPEQKRKIIGRVFIEVFDSEANKIQDVKWLAQGTIYPDVIESVSLKGDSVAVKSHHNVGGLPDTMKLKIVEPLRLLFKDEVRRVGAELEIPNNILNRHPFPGPGLGIRILGDITEKKVEILQEVDSIFIDGLKDNGLYEKVWQAGAILLPIQSVGVSGDSRTYESVVALRAVMSVDGMTADWVHLPHEFLAWISNEIITKVKGVNRVVYDISSKPPATIEWE